MGRDKSARPDVAEFMGQAYIILDLDPLATVTNTLTLPLCDGAEGGLPNRKLTGDITLQYDWVPTATTFDGGGEPSATGPVEGTLKVTVMWCEGLMNLVYSRGKRTGSNPYCRVFCYPDSPVGEQTLRPSAWRSPLAVGTLSPKWNASHTFNFLWAAPKMSS